MSGMFGGSAPKLPAPMPAPPPPTIDQAVQNQRQDSANRMRRGAAANVLAGTQPQNPQTSVAKLLGQ